MKVRGFAVLGAICCVAYGQTGTIAGPSAGYVFDPNGKALRQVRGIPGAALLSEPLDLRMTLTDAAVSPRGDLAIAIDADGAAHLFKLNGGAATERAVPNLMASAASVIFSPSGAAAALYRPGSVQVLKGLPDAPEVATTLAVPSMGSVAAEAAAMGRMRQPAHETIAISDDAAYVLFARSGEVDLLSVAGGVRKLVDGHAGAMVAFAAGNHDAAIAAGGVVTLYEDIAGASTRRDFPGAGLSGGLAFSADGARILLAGPRSVVVIDRTTGIRSLVECDFKPTGITAMGAMFRLNEPGSGPLWLLDGGAPEPKLIFVPAL
jgi:hypothetical protein